MTLSAKSIFTLAVLWLCACTGKGPENSPRYGESSPPQAEPNPAAGVEEKNVEVAAAGMPYALRLTASLLDFCDDRGLHSIDLITHLESRPAQGCPKMAPPDAGCTALPGQVKLSSKASDANDTLSYAGLSYSLQGRILDCALDAKRLVVATTRNVVAILPDVPTPVTLSSNGADRVTAYAGWVAYSQRNKVMATQKH
ncbi:hypothetical protein [Bryobacter aggregatus]|uniref:hypothetical protein n=1 Tax=Bryobacter aggregatus TaxID=360054 RepID=UPI0004E2413B|nr:hypothetical protein [Bryobacter aggregatus]